MERWFINQIDNSEDDGDFTLLPLLVRLYLQPINEDDISQISGEDGVQIDALARHFILNHIMDHQAKECKSLNSSIVSVNDVYEPTVNSNGENEDKQRATLVEWLNSILPNLNLQAKASEEELRACLIDGTVLCRVLNKLRPGSVTECGGSSEPCLENVRRFLVAMDKMRMPRFQVSDLEKNAPTQSLLSVVNGILDESIERKNGEIPHQNNLFKAREEKHQSRIRVLEALATGTT
ncbi:hypothetical protein F0562_023797 [Nyssa sinensis]|uniref:Calponin-homology (CH) domain-containing protein n=1 Tax=Nyssa sinensis TaxID=561372 RepID=A0A5J5BJ07_9ASTE|nr:hypothetical protein F0562_023797 [Nyssa sinensis]